MIEYGRLAEPYGVRGWIRVVVDEPEVLAAAPVWWIGGVARTVRESRPHSGTLLARLEGIETPEQARTFKGLPVSIPRPEAGEGRFFWSDLVGLEVVNEQGEVLGVVKRMFSNGAHDVMELSGERERLLPWVPPVVKKVDLQAKRIEVEWGADW
ncbi:MAG: ribosome maturation factor RimM [Betaproteobacteria bacterium]